MPLPIAVMIVRISSFDSTLSMRAFSTLMILPRSGRIAWKSRLAALLGGAAGRVALDEVELAERRIGERAVGELAGQVADVERRLAAREIARLARRFARARRRHRLFDDDVRRARMLLEVRREPLVDERLHRRLDFGVAELGLGLPFELRLADLDRQHGGEAFAHVVAGEREVRPS